MAENDLKSLPADIAKLTFLEVLDLGDNLALEDISETIAYLPKLRYLNLMQTNLKNYPACIFAPVCLSELVFLGNHLPHLPASIGQASHLKKLYLDDVELQTISPEIVQLKNLRTLSLSYNPYLMQNLAWVDTIACLHWLEELYLLTIKLPDDTWAYLKKSLPNTTVYGSAYNYFQDIVH